MEEKAKVEVKTKENSSTEKNVITFSRKVRILIVIATVAIFALIMFFNIKGAYLRYEEIGEKYISVLETNLRNDFNFFIVSFIVIFISIFISIS